METNTLIILVWNKSSIRNLSVPQLIEHLHKSQIVETIEIIQLIETTDVVQIAVVYQSQFHPNFWIESVRISIGNNLSITQLT